MAIYMCDIHAARTEAAKHFAYIMREGSYKNKEGLMTDDGNNAMIGNGNLPEWAVKNPKSFWKADDKFEKGNKYREAIIALPNELPATELIALVKKIQQRICPKSAYSYAIHDSIGSLSGTKNTHVHLMFCEREIEPERAEPDKENYFKKSRTLKGGIGISGGYRKGEKFGKARRKWLKEVRQNVEDCINEALERNGINQKVSSKSLKTQRDEYASLHPEATQEELDSRFHMPSPKLGSNRIFLFKNAGIKSDRYQEYEDVKKYNSVSDEIYQTQKNIDALNKEQERIKIEKDSLLKEYNAALAKEKNTPSKVVVASVVNSLVKDMDEEKKYQGTYKGTASALDVNALKESTIGRSQKQEAQERTMPQQNKTPVVTSHLSAFNRPGHYKSVFVSVDGGKAKMYDEKNFDKLLEQHPDVAKKYGITIDIVNAVKSKSRGKKR